MPNSLQAQLCLGVNESCDEYCQMPSLLFLTRNFNFFEQSKYDIGSDHYPHSSTVVLIIYASVYDFQKLSLEKMNLR